MADKSPEPRRTRWRLLTRWTIACIFLAGMAWLLRGTLLTAIAWPLVIHESMDSPTAVLIVSGDGQFPETMRIRNEHPDCDVLLLKRAPNRLERLGLLKTSVEVGFEELKRRNVPPSKIHVVTLTGQEERGVDELAGWFRDHPDARLIVLSDAFASRVLRWQFNRELPSDIARRLSIHPLHSPAFNPSNWWQSKVGCTQFVRSWLGLILPVVQGPSPKWQECNPDIFQAAKP